MGGRGHDVQANLPCAQHQNAGRTPSLCINLLSVRHKPSLISDFGRFRINALVVVNADAVSGTACPNRLGSLARREDWL